MAQDETSGGSPRVGTGRTLRFNLGQMCTDLGNGQTSMVGPYTPS